MPTSSKQFKYLLVLLCEVSNFIVTHPMKEIHSNTVCEILVDYFIAYFSTPQSDLFVIRILPLSLACVNIVISNMVSSW